MIVPAAHKDIRGYRKIGSMKFYVATGAVLDLLFPDQMQWIDEEALKEGERNHKAMHCAITSGVCGEEFPRVRALWDWLSEHKFDLGLARSEVSHVTDHYGHGGTIDGELFGPSSEEILADWKFAESIEPRYLFQLQAYDHLLPWRKRRLMLFQVTKACKVIPINVKRDAGQWGLFLNALAVLKFRLK